jgi:hypothetical protein
MCGVEVLELLGAGPTRRRLQAAAMRGLSRFVGRQTELDQLRRGLEQARRGTPSIRRNAASRPNRWSCGRR